MKQSLISAAGVANVVGAALAQSESPDSGPLLPARKVWERYDVTDRTLDRWLEREELGFPKPLVINGRRYFRQYEIESWERARAATKTEAA